MSWWDENFSNVVNFMKDNEWLAGWLGPILTIAATIIIPLIIYFIRKFVKTISLPKLEFYIVEQKKSKTSASIPVNLRLQNTSSKAKNFKIETCYPIMGKVTSVVDTPRVNGPFLEIESKVPKMINLQPGESKDFQIGRLHGDCNTLSEVTIKWYESIESSVRMQKASWLYNILFYRWGISSKKIRNLFYFKPVSCKYLIRSLTANLSESDLILDPKIENRRWIDLSVIENNFTSMILFSGKYEKEIYYILERALDILSREKYLILMSYFHFTTPEEFKCMKLSSFLKYVERSKDDYHIERLRKVIGVFKYDLILFNSFSKKWQVSDQEYVTAIFEIFSDEAFIMSKDYYIRLKKLRRLLKKNRWMESSEVISLFSIQFDQTLYT